MALEHFGAICQTDTIKAVGCGLIDANAITQLGLFQCGTSGFSKWSGLPSRKLRMFSIACS
jgi:hypothetical protein